jgi:hypothetical protein
MPRWTKYFDRKHFYRSVEDISYLTPFEILTIDPDDIRF